MRRTNCPNCGAPIEHYYNYQCPYCKTFLYNTEPNEKIDKIDTDRNNIIIDEVVIEKSFLQSGWVMTLYCTAFPKLQRVFQEETCTTMDSPRQCGYQIIFDCQMVRALYDAKNTWEYLFQVLKAHIPPYILDYSFNMNKIIQAVMDCEIIGRGLRV